MSSRPKIPKYARNKNVLVVGGSGSGKTRFFIKPNLLQMHSSYVVTDPKGGLVNEVGNALYKNGYRIKVFNTINFLKSMHYNPFAYLHSEKDILKLVTTLIANTKGESKGGDDFWLKAETLLYTAYPYVWGGSNPNTSFDCSGFVSWALTQSGVCNTGRLGAQGLYNISTPVSSANARPGDLIFFIGTYDTPGVSHVGIYVGGGKMLHCGDPIQYADINTSYWQSHFYAFGRPPYN